MFLWKSRSEGRASGLSPSTEHRLPVCEDREDGEGPATTHLSLWNSRIMPVSLSPAEGWISLTSTSSSLEPGASAQGHSQQEQGCGPLRPGLSVLPLTLTIICDLGIVSSPGFSSRQTSYLALPRICSCSKSLGLASLPVSPRSHCHH